MNTQVCVNCLNKKPINQTNNRLVTESCGHVKCMDCLLREKSGCQACRGSPNGLQENGDELDSKQDDSNLSPEVHHTDDGSTVEIRLDDCSKKKKPETSHITIETVPGGGRCYMCTVCKKRFHARSQVAYHAYCNGQSKPYQCPECNKSFATHSHFKYHMRVHRNERTYSCDVCGDSFFQMSKLQRHKLKHTKEKKYVCGQCNKAFNNVTSLRKHGLTHTEERPFACAACGRRFRDGSNYRKHLAKHDGSPPSSGRCRSPGGRRAHQCPRCPQAFHSSKDMKRHAAVHTDSKPFRCKVCNRRFRRKDNLERHIRNTHPDFVPASAVECDVSALNEITSANGTPNSDEKREKTMLEILNPLPPLPQEVIQKHIMEVNENVSQNNQESKETAIDKSYILEANNARQSVIVEKVPNLERKVTINSDEYIHKIRKANSMVSQKNVTLPPIDEEKIKQLHRLNSLDVGAPPKNMELYKKILYEKPEIDVGGSNEEEKVRSSSPEMHWRRKMKLNIN
ncbi:zinc finger and SCAN domain-containing protein 21 [Amyelois transitella]|uniref:zinc finger and SCAN domain-containing protein 21 n=1 Tax=Amyelois transitella TaxID=680683 RepID=UPI00067D4C48|nr:zinc finger and SCAN domain-containing protein 21 [Amyelois transitella]